MKQTAPRPVLVDNNQLFQIFALTAFCTVDNLRKVANALPQKDEKTLEQAASRNEKIPRLCQEMEKQVLLQMAEPDLPERERKKLLLLMQIALMLQRMGDQTVEAAQLARQLLPLASSEQTIDTKKMLEHAVYLTDKMATGFLEEKESSIQVAVAEEKKAQALFEEIHQERLENLSEKNVQPDSFIRIIDLAHDMIEQSTQLAHQVNDFLHNCTTST